MPRAPPLPDVLSLLGWWDCWSNWAQLGSHPSAGPARQGSALEPPGVVFNPVLPRSRVSSDRPAPRRRRAVWQGGGAGHQHVSEVPLVVGSAWWALRAAGLVLLGPGGSPPCRTVGCWCRRRLGWSPQCPASPPPQALPRLGPAAHRTPCLRRWNHLLVAWLFRDSAKVLPVLSHPRSAMDLILP